MFGNLNHIAIAVPDLEVAMAKYRLLGSIVSAPQSLPEHGVRVAFVELPNTKVELLEPLGSGSPISEFLVRNPSGGVHHVCFEVDDILAARAKMIESGTRIVGGPDPKIGAHGKPVLFAHPKDMFGTLVEIEQV